MQATYRPTHLLVVEDAGGHVNVAALQHPDARLHYYTQQGLLIHRQRVIAAPAAAEIYDALRARFRHAAASPAPNWTIGSAWYVLEFDAVTAAIGEYDLQTGVRRASGPLTAGARVKVDGFGAGQVKGFSPCGRVVVDFDRYPHIALQALAPTCQVVVS